MKSKVELLAGQALDRVVPYTWTTLDYEEIHELLAYHAELIIKECAGIGSNIVLEQTEDNDMGVFLGIKKHFGVEE